VYVVYQPQGRPVTGWQQGGVTATGAPFEYVPLRVRESVVSKWRRNACLGEGETRMNHAENLKPPAAGMQRSVAEFARGGYSNSATLAYGAQTSGAFITRHKKRANEDGEAGCTCNAMRSARRSSNVQPRT